MGTRWRACPARQRHNPLAMPLDPVALSALTFLPWAPSVLVFVFVFVVFVGTEDVADVIELALQLFVLGLQLFYFGFQFGLAFAWSCHTSISPCGVFYDLKALLIGVLARAEAIDPVRVVIHAQIVKARDRPAPRRFRLRKCFEFSHVQPKRTRKRRRAVRNCWGREFWSQISPRISGAGSLSEF